MYGSNNSWHNIGSPHFGSPLNKTYSIATYATNSQKKTELKDRDSIFDQIPTDLHKLPNLLQKNLGDTITVESKETPKMAPLAQQTKVFATRTETPFTGISNFFSNMVSVVTGVVFHKRAKSPVPPYYDCVDDLDDTRDLFSWHPANSDVQNKNKAPNDQIVDMNAECRAAAAHCEDKLLKVRQLLTTDIFKVPTKSRPRRPRRVFVDAASIEEDFVDAFSSEDFFPLPNDDFIEYISPFAHQNGELLETDSPKIRTNVHCEKPEEKTRKSLLDEKMDVCNIGKTNLETSQIKADMEQSLEIKEELNIKSTEEPSEKNSKDIPKEAEVKTEIISSCEDKMTKLKSLLTKCKINTKCKSDPDCNKNCKPVRIYDKHFKNPCRRSGSKRSKQTMRKEILEDMIYEIDDESGTEESPNHSLDSKSLDGSFTTNSSVESSESLKFGDHFNEVTGRFRTASTTESEDSFQIVFTDTPKQRRMSDCESEDSFIVFEDTPDSCYVTNDVISDDSDTDEDSDTSDTDTDSGHAETSRLSPFLSRTISDLTDDSLYEEKCCDEVDCAVRMCEEIPCHKLIESPQCGLLIDGSKKKLKSNLPPKKVTFSSAPPKVHTLRVWAFAARQARPGPWEQMARDRERFQRRIANVEMSISWVLKPQHRSRVVFQRFRPWWNAQRRLEIAAEEEKKNRAKVDVDSADVGECDIRESGSAEDVERGVDVKELEVEKDVKIVQCVNDIEKDDDIKHRSSQFIETVEIQTEIVVETEIATQILTEAVAPKRDTEANCQAIVDSI